MNRTAAVNYFIPPEGYIWRWADDGSAVEWNGDSTVCLWMELHALLNYLVPHGLPPLGSIVMVLMAAQQKSAVVFHDAMRKSGGGHYEATPTSRRLLLRLKEVLERVQALPTELRSGLSARAHLLRTLFDGVQNRRPPDDSRALLELSGMWGIEAFAEHQPNITGSARLLQDLKALASVYEACDLRGLESLLRTGLDAVNLQPAPIPEPKPEPGDSALPLLRQLELHRDTELSALAGLARRMVAMFSLPRPAGHPQELPVGGISDITNRGPLDRLLPGELAYDDLTLSARLANNEALYYRRDTPPDEPATERVLLLDTGIHLWGTPRVFTLAAALGLQAGATKGESVRVLRREGDAFLPLALNSVAAVRDCLTSLHAAPDPEAAIRAFQLDESSALRPDVFFLSIPWQRESVSRALHDLALRIAECGGRFYTLAITRTGALELSVRTAAGSRVLTHGRIDPATLFPSAPGEERPAAKARSKLFNLPVQVEHLGFYQLWPLPFLFPAEPKPWSKPLLHPGARVGVTADRRLMKWTGDDPAASEIAAGLPAGREHHVFADGSEWVIVSSADRAGGKVHAVRIGMKSGACTAVQLAASHAFPFGVKVMHGAAILGYSDKAEACSINDGAILDSISLDGRKFVGLTFDGTKLQCGEAPAESAAATQHESIRSELPEQLSAPISAGFDSAGTLVIRAKGGSWEFPCPNIIWTKTPKSMLSAVRPFTLIGDENGEDGPCPPAFYTAEWNLDCRLIFDTRGILHIVYHDMHGLVEMAVLCLLDKATAAWVRHWPEGKQHLGAKSWFHPKCDGQPVVNLTPLMQRFSAMARG